MAIPDTGSLLLDLRGVYGDLRPVFRWIPGFLHRIAPCGISPWTRRREFVARSEV